MTGQEAQDRRIDYIEFNVADIARAKAFYGASFGWTFVDFGPDYCEFSDGRLKGGFAASGANPDGGPESNSEVRSGGPLVVLYAVDLEAMQARVEAAGGQIVQPIFDFPGGRRFHFRDTEGYELAVWTTT